MSIEPMWLCGECGVQHNFEDDARECCAPTARKVYGCPVCGRTYDNAKQAEDCRDACTAGIPLGPTKAALEAAGQMTLTLKDISSELP